MKYEKQQKAMSTCENPYFEWLTNGASRAVRDELQQMERSNVSSFRSSADIIKARYGLGGTR